MKWVTTFLKLQLAASALFSFSFASDIDELTKIASKRKSVRDLYSDSTALKDFTFYLDRYLGKVYPQCPRGQALPNIARLLEKAPALDSLLWADTSEESYEFSLPKPDKGLVLRRISKTSLSTLLFDSPDDCTNRICTKRDQFF